MNHFLAILIFERNTLNISYSMFKLEDFYFFTRDTIKEIILVSTKSIVQKISEDDKVYIVEFDEETKSKISKNIKCVAVANGDFFFVAITKDYDFPILSACILKDIIKEKESRNINKIIEKYNNVQHVEKINSMQKDINETKEILLISIDKLLDRGAKLEELLVKSEELSFTSNKFLKSSQNLNKCCYLL